MITLFNQKKTVEQIHREFDTAQERLLAEAISIIENNQVSTDKGERLEKLGFTSTKEVKEYRTKKRALVVNTEQAELIKYYKQEYPFQKFLTVDELDRICKKYNLIYAPVGNYKENVPDKNLAEIETSKKLNKKDKAGNLIKVLGNRFRSGRSGYRKFLRDYPDGLVDSELLRTRHYNIETALFTLYDFHVSKYRETKRKGLFIAAPKSHFNLKGLKNKGLGFFNSKVFEVKDPIVFRHCRGGIQVLSKWGLEANDPALANEILN